MTRHSLRPEVERVLEEHAFSEVRQEVGGLLVGTLGDDGPTVTAVLPALSAQTGQTHVTFTHEVWETALAELDRDHPEDRIVGWYHTHPGFGLFLSEYDRFVHQEFFSDPRMVALVVDPVAGTRGWFQDDGELRLVQEERTTREAVPSALSAPGEATTSGGSRHRVPALLAVPALLILGAVAGYSFGGAGSEVSAAPPQAATTVSPAQPTATPDGQVAQDDADAEADADADADAEHDAEADALRTELARVVAEAPTGFRYQVRRGDSMSGIAVSVYGDPDGWRTIAAANPGVDANLLAIGQALCVPLRGSDGSTPRTVTCR